MVTEEETWTCPNCGGKMKRVVNNDVPYFVCPDCGSSLEESDLCYELKAICPNCHQPMDGNECSYCGYDLGSDFD